MTASPVTPPVTCPECGSRNVEQDDPQPGEHKCRDCGAPVYP